MYLRVEEKEIERRVKRLRADLQAKLEDRLHNMKDEVMLERKEQELKRIRGAFGIKDDAREGSAFNFETERQRQERVVVETERERVKEHIKRIRGE